MIVPLFTGIKYHFKHPFRDSVLLNEVHFFQTLQSTEGTLNLKESLKSICYLIGGSCS